MSGKQQGSINGALTEADIDHFIPRQITQTMLDVILAWARVDSAIAQLSAASFGLNPTEGAILMHGVSVTSRIMKVRTLQLQLGREDQAKALKTLKSQYEDHAGIRNIIAHASCVGVLKRDRSVVVFVPFSVAERYGELLIEAHHVQTMREAIRWADTVKENAVAMLDEVQFYATNPSAGSERTPPMN